MYLLLQRVWDECDLVLTPVTLGPAPSLAQFCRADNRQQTAVQDFCTQPANLAGVPALSLPARLTRSDPALPLAVQLMAPRGEDEELLRAGAWLENQLAFPRLAVDWDRLEHEAGPD